MTLLYRTAKRWTDPDGLVIDWHLSDDGEQLTVMLDYAATVKARKDNVICMSSQWQNNGGEFETVTSSIMPARGVLRIVAERCD